MDRIITVENVHGIPESDVNHKLEKLGNDWQVISAITTVGAVDTTSSGGSDRIYITTIVVRNVKKNK